jgi:hypothetical protein
LSKLTAKEAGRFSAERTAPPTYQQPAIVGLL